MQSLSYYPAPSSQQYGLSAFITQQPYTKLSVLNIFRDDEPKSTVSQKSIEDYKNSITVVRLDRNLLNMPHTATIARNGNTQKTYIAEMLNSMTDASLGYFLKFSHSELEQFPIREHTTGRNCIFTDPLTNEPLLNTPNRYLGSGSHSTVKFARLRDMGDEHQITYCAAKKIKPKGLMLPTTVQNTSHDAHLEARLQEKALKVSPKIYGTADTMDKCGIPEFIIFMEILKGDDCLSYAMNNDLQFSQSKALALKLINLVEHLHSIQIIHGNLKSEDIFILRDTQEIKCIDFGNAMEGLFTFTELDYAWAHMAPELVRSGIKRTTPIDIFSLGVCFY